MQRPAGVGAFEFVTLASLRATQLLRGCLPRVDGGHKKTVTALLEVSQGKVVQGPRLPPVPATVNDVAVIPEELVKAL